MTDYASRLALPQQSEPEQATDYSSRLTQPQDRSLTLSDIKIEPGKGASFATLSKAATVDDPKTKLKIFAKARFGDENASDRYGIVGGEVLYVGDDGKIHQETPDGWIEGAKQLVAGAVGKSPTLAGAGYGAMAGAPLGPVGAITGAMAGAFSGEGVRKTIGNVAFDEPQTTEGNLKSMLGESGFAVLGELGGSLFAKGLQKNLVRDIKRLDVPGMAALEDKAAKAGVDLYPAQTTNLRSIKSRHETLGRLDASADIIQEGGQKQAEQANRAAYDYFGSLSRIGDAATASVKGKAAAEDIIKRLDNERAALAAPFYKKAFEKPVMTTPELAQLANTPIMQQALTTAKRLAANEGIDLGDPRKTMLGLHWTKMALDNMIQSAPQQGIGGVERGQIIGIKNKLLDFMDKADVNYGLGRYFYAGESEGIGKAQAGIVGDMADKERSVGQLASRLFSPTADPLEIRNARRLFERSNKMDEWNGLVRAYLQDQFEMAGRYTDGILGQAPRFRKNMIGNPRQKEILKQALPPDQYNALLDLSDVFEAIGRVKGYGGSPTMPLMEGAEALRRESQGLVGKALAPMTALKEWIVEARLGKHAEKLAEIMTTPGDIRRLKQLRQLSPNDQKFIAGVSALLGVSASPSRAGEVTGQQLDQTVRQ